MGALADFKFNLGQCYDISNRNNNAIVGSLYNDLKNKEAVRLLYLSLIDLENYVCEVLLKRIQKKKN